MEYRSQSSITQGIGDYFELEHTEMYGERFDIPEPDQTLFLSWFPGGEVFRSGCVWNRGNGRVFYFKPGHETFPIYYDKNIQQVIRNAIAWCMPTVNLKLTCPMWSPWSRSSRSSADCRGYPKKDYKFWRPKAKGAAETGKAGLRNGPFSSVCR